MWMNDVIVWIVVFFAIVGALDRIAGNRFGYGESFERGFMAMGPVALAMIGVISFSPVLADLLRPFITPLFQAMGADPAVFAGMLFAIDMGGYPLSVDLAESTEVGLFSGIILATMVGPVFVFTIPVALGIIDKADHPLFAKGILIGLIPVPIGAYIAGLVAGFSPTLLIVNLIPVVLFSLIIAIGLLVWPGHFIKGFIGFGKVIIAFLTLTGAVVIFETLTGSVLVPGTAPFVDAIEIVGLIAITLAGAFPLVHFLRTAFQRVIEPAAIRLGIKQVSIVGLLSSLAHSIPMFQVLNEMDERGKVINVAFAVSGAFVLGGHLGFTASVEPEMITAMMSGKLTAGILACAIAFFTVKTIKYRG
ncbi:ethanolamine utilization protein EutH [Alteribacter populi]|uniref:ethanolamine utilization protein EutH n=1 Tax=Alteribacter populi TaxID=2011011 RepID=UPI000BBA6CAB|nr:ethanolamine utilization protein EutH [Alteribacter populi]